MGTNMSRVEGHSARAGSVAAFGKPFNTMYRFDRANAILSLDADFLCSGMPGGLSYARDYADRRACGCARSEYNASGRLYVAEGTPSITGGMADHRFRMRTSEVEAFAEKLPDAVMKDLAANRGAGIGVIAGEHASPRASCDRARLECSNWATPGKRCSYTDPVEVNPVDEIASLSEQLVRDMKSGAVDTAADSGRQNPVYDAPADLRVSGCTQKR